MREVNSCDFCGEEAAGTFEVVPAERDPAGEGHRMVLCADCRDTLGSVLEPLLDGEPAGREDAAGEEATGTATVVAEPQSGSGGGVTAEDSPGPDVGPTDESVPGANPETGAETDAVSPAEDGAEGSADGSSGRSQSTRRGTPRGYRKVMRFLENREFPMDREEAETLAAEAYGVDQKVVSAAIDHAVKHGRLREVSGELRQ